MNASTPGPNDRTLVITGGCGLIGLNLLYHLASKGRRNPLCHLDFPLPLTPDPCLIDNLPLSIIDYRLLAEQASLIFRDVHAVVFPALDPADP